MVEAGQAGEEEQQLPWMQVEKEYRFATDDGTKTLAELFDGRPRLLAYYFLFGPDCTGACPGCSRLAAHFDGGADHLISHDVTFVSISRAPLGKLQAYKRRKGWQFPWVSSFGSIYPYESGWNVFELSGGDVYRISSRRTRCV